MHLDGLKCNNSSRFRIYSMRNRDYGTSFGSPLQCLQHLFLSLGIQICRNLIQQKKLRLRHGGSGNG